MYKKIAKKVFWEFDFIIMQNLSDIFHCFGYRHGRLITWVKSKNFDVMIAYTKVIRMHNGGGSENVDQRSLCSRERVKFREKFERSVLIGLEELLKKNQVFQWQSNFIPSVSHNLSKCFLRITPVHRW